MMKNKRMVATLLLLALIGAVLWIAAAKCYDLERETCFERLTSYTRQVGREIRNSYEADRAFLERVSNLLSRYDLTDFEEVGECLSSLGGKGMVSRLELLLPGDKLLTGSGELVDVSGQLSYRAETAEGIHISRRCSDPLDPDRLILRYYVPVAQNGDTAALLCGIVDLSALPEIFTVNGYGDEMQLYILESGTGNFLQDTWHDRLGTVRDLGTRRTKKGYDWDAFNRDVAQGKASTVVFLSKNAGKYFYLYAEPVGVEDWMVMLNVTEEAVFVQAKNMLRFIGGLAVLLLAAFACYFIWMLRDIRQDQLVSEKQLRNVRYMLDVEKELFDAHMQPAHFISALQKVADYLTAEIAFFWLAEGLPHVKRRIWSNLGQQPPDGGPGLAALLPDIFPILREKGAILTYTMDALAREMPSIGSDIARRKIRSLMLIPVTGLNGELALILGACNMGRQWENTAPLEQISLSFSMAINHYGAHQILRRMGQVDSLTGLLNRNSYHAALEALSAEDVHSFACVYIDVNGLHELNNHLGHLAGDRMLKSVAEGLREAFTACQIYRIGGDEFVILCQDQGKEEICERTRQVREVLEAQGYRLSIGIEWRDKNLDIKEIINTAEGAMQQDKRQYYQHNGKERQMRALNQQLEQMIVEKQDADAFLSVLAPEFRGVYFVNLGSDTIRHLYIPPYFEAILKEAGDVFSKALMLYAHRIVMPEYFYLFDKFCDYRYLEAQLNAGGDLEFNYQRLDGAWLQLRILKFKNYTAECRETLWIFSNMDG